MPENDPFRVCIFIKGKECLVDADEIPLEVCRMCIDAWKVQVSMNMVKRGVFTAPTEPSAARRLGLPASLVELDHMFENGEIELDEYISEREKMLKSLRQQIP
ncbi:hypothetical protein KEJ25_05710 [Candidatus Bathyarchaeota archaeon]|nr:hypothetical protein [Candidatus Brockarchaeota archaeon]MBS7618082.1 hypothetical protein [Candidatus Bathyarchaeota archaeon]